MPALPPDATDPAPTTDAERSARAFPGGVPVLTDEAAGVRLRAHTSGDLRRIVEQSRDPDSIRWTTVPRPTSGYSLADAQAYLDLVSAGWRAGTQLSWAVEERDRPGTFCGSIDLRLEGDGVAEVGFGLHPAARGRRLMGAALRLVRDHAFEVVGMQVLRWRAAVGNWPSRRVAARAGFRVEGRVRQLLVHRGERLDGWIATLTATDPRTPAPWLDPPPLSGGGLALRGFTDADAERVAQACADRRTQQWLVSLPRRYGRPEALAYLEQTRELAAAASATTWCVTDAGDDRCLGSVSLEGGGYSRRAEIGYWSHPDARGRGVVSTAVGLVTAYAESTAQVDSLMIRVAGGNTASRRVATAAGYREVGVLRAAEPLGDGSLDDLVLYARP